jgi:hypothetical protein
MKRENILRLIQLAAIFSYILFLSGCWSTPPKPPSIPPGINAKLPTYGYGSRLNWTNSDDRDALVLFYIDFFVQYAEQDKPGRINDWFIYKLDKIATLEGQFDEDEISFLCFTGHSKPNGWQFDPVPIQYKRRMVLQLGLKKQDKHYNIVSQQQRSWLAPYGKLIKPEQAANFEQIINSVCSHLKIDQAKFKESWKLYLKNYASQIELVVSVQDSELKAREQARFRNNAVLPGVGNFEIVDENDEYYVIRVRLQGENEEHLMVNKTTFEVSPLPVPEKN